MQVLGQLPSTSQATRVQLTVTVIELASGRGATLRVAPWRKSDRLRYKLDDRLALRPRFLLIVHFSESGLRLGGRSWWRWWFWRLRELLESSTMPPNKTLVSFVAEMESPVEWLEVVAAQESRNSMELRLAHSSFQADYPRECTVTCLASGESRTGHHPCITCEVGSVKVRLCC